MTGEPLAPVLPATAAAWAAGVLDPEHLRTIQKFMRELPDHVGLGVAGDSEALLAEKAALLRPDQLEVLADRLAITVNPDGVFSDEDWDAASPGGGGRSQMRWATGGGAV